MYMAVQNTLASYFILSLIIFGNLSLMYEFIELDSLPSFVREINEASIKLLYEEASLFKLISQAFNFSEESFQIPLEEGHIKENMPSTNRYYHWFGYFGISSKPFRNNIDYFLSIGALLGRILAAKLIYFFICAKFKIFSTWKLRILLLLASETLAFVPFIVISSLSMSI